MSDYLITTHEHVTGQYLVRAESGEEALRVFEGAPYSTGEQLEYSAFEVNVVAVRPAEEQS